MPAPCPFKRVRDMACEKTGAHARLPDGRWAYGDMHEFNGVRAFRICQVSEYGAEPLMSVLHYTIVTYETWFDQHRDRQDINNSTMMCLPHQVVNHGYNGTLIMRLKDG